MGISSRDYIRERPIGGDPFIFGQTVKGLIVANVVIYILQVLIAPLTQWLDLSTANVLRGEVWRLFTYGFCHDRFGVLHIVFNMLFLWWFGRDLERMYGAREILLYYLSAIVLSGVAFVGLDLATGGRIPTVGASGGVMAILMLYAMHFPYEKIRLWMLFPIPVIWLVIAYVIFDLHPVLLALVGEQTNTGVAHAAHLGGLAFGYAYYKMSWRLSGFLDQKDRARVTPRKASRPPIANSAPAPKPRAKAAPVLSEQDRVDLLLEKISQHGMDSLSDEERKFLDQASETMRGRR